MPNGDSQSFAKAIDVLLTDTALAEKYSKQAHRRVTENFLVPNMIEKQEECYDKLSDVKTHESI